MTFPDPQSTTVVELAFGADIADPDSWTWTDVTADLPAQAITINRGRQDEQSEAQPGDCTIVLDNISGAYTPDHPMSSHYPDVVTGIPVRITVQGSVRFVGQVASWEPVWPEGDLSDLADLSQLEDEEALRGHALVTIRCAGILQRLQTTSAPLQSAIFRATMSRPSVVAYWPLEDAEDASFVASPIPGVKPARLTGTALVDLGQEPVSPGSGPSIRLTAGVTSAGELRCTLPLSGSSSWVVESVFAVEDDTPGGAVWSMTVTDGEGAVWIVDATLAGETLTIELTWAPDDETSPTSLTTEAVDRGTYHQVRLYAAPAPSGVAWTLDVDGVEVDDGTQSFAPQTDWPRSIAILGNELRVGHVAAYDNALVQPLPTWPAVTGFAGESTLDRFRRLALEVRLPLQVARPELAADTFTRSVTGGWGTADSGQTWTPDDDAADFTVAGGVGVIDGLDSGRWITLPVDEPDVEVAASVAFTAAPDEDGEYDASLLARYTDTGNYYEFAINVTTGDGSQVMHLDVWRRVATVYELLTSTRLDLAFAANDRYQLVGQVAGTRLRAKVWPAGTEEPSEWMAEAFDHSHTETALAGCAGFSFDTTVNPIDFDDFAVQAVPASAALGPQQIATLVEILQVAADADGGILFESRDALGLSYRPLVSLYNQDPALTLDADADNQGDIVNPFAPVLDDQAATNDVTVTRTDGSSARATDPSDIDRRGLRNVEVELNVASDDQLPGQATWRLHLGTWPGMRYPAVTPALNARPGLITGWLPLDAGDRIDVTNLPPQHPPNDVTLILQGYAETIRPTAWETEVNCSPYGPYEIGQVAAADGSEDARGQAVDTDWSTLASGIDSDDTTLSVATDTSSPLRGLWTVDPDDWDDDLHGGPLVIDINGEWMQVTDITGASSPQTFTVVRAANGIVRAHDAGSAVHVAHPARVGL